MNRHATRSRRLTSARAVALAVIAVSALGLVALRVTSGDSSVTVPQGAHAGQILLHSCTYGTEAGRLPADCGTLVVPENRQNPDSRLIALPVTRVYAKTEHPGAPVFYLQGGPRLSNMDFRMASRFVAHRDVVVVGYRGVDGSTKLDCPEVTSALTGSSDLIAAKTLQAYSAAFRNCADRLTKDGVDLAGYNLVERVDDMEAARAALGYRTIDLISESAGTRTAMIYSWRYPKSINRSVMLGVNPPGHYLYDGPTTDAQLAHYSELCASDPSCRDKTANLTAEMRDLSRNLPDRWLFLPIKPGNVELATFYGFVNATSVASPLSAPQTIGTWNSAAHGDASGMWLLSLLADLTVPTSHAWGDLPATGQIDDEAATAYYAHGGDQGSILGNPFTDSLWGGGGLIKAWPHSPEVDQYRQLRPTSVDTLLISGDVDFATPAQFATTELLPTLEHGHQVILRSLGHTDDTWNYEKPAFDRLVNTFFDTGRVDRSGYPTRATDFDAPPSQTMIAKIVLTALVGVAALMPIILLLVALRLRRRGNVGGKTGVAVRALYAPLLGLGGLSTGVLLLLTAWPSASLASGPVTILCVGVPVALAVYCGWVQRTWPRATRLAGLAAAAAGAAVGGWLGLHVIDGSLSMFIAIVGAVLGANLAVISHDLARPARTATAERMAGGAAGSALVTTRT